MKLFGWLTMANGDQTGLENADAQAVAGTLNRNRVYVDPGEASPITINCWPEGTTSDIPQDLDRMSESIIVTGSRIPPVAAPPAPPPPPPFARGERDDGYMAQEERLGDVRLYRIPIEVSVAARSQKQIALLDRPSVNVSTVLRLRPDSRDFEMPLERVLVTQNRASEGLGLALPAGRLALYGQRGGRRILLGEGTIDDHAVGEKVEIAVAMPTGVIARQVTTGYHRDHRAAYRLTLTSDLSHPQPVAIELPLVAKAAPGVLAMRGGWQVWSPTIPANGTVELEYHY